MFLRELYRRCQLQEHDEVRAFSILYLEEIHRSSISRQDYRERNDNDDDIDISPRPDAE